MTFSGWDDIRNNLFRRLPRAGGQPGAPKRCGGKLKKPASADLIQELCCILRKFGVEKFLKGGRI